MRVYTKPIIFNPRSQNSKVVRLYLYIIHLIVGIKGDFKCSGTLNILLEELKIQILNFLYTKIITLRLL